MPYTDIERKRAYDRNYNHQRYGTISRYRICKAKRIVEVIYPDCSLPDQMSLTELRRWTIQDFPPETKVFIRGQEVRVWKRR